LRLLLGHGVHQDGVHVAACGQLDALLRISW
jgi:hypothetical protein